MEEHMDTSPRRSALIPHIKGALTAPAPSQDRSQWASFGGFPEPDRQCEPSECLGDKGVKCFKTTEAVPCIPQAFASGSSFPQLPLSPAGLLSFSFRPGFCKGLASPPSGHSASLGPVSRYDCPVFSVTV